MLIFGISGFIGRHFCKYLKDYSIENDINIVGVVRQIQSTLNVEVNGLEVVDA